MGTADYIRSGSSNDIEYALRSAYRSALAPVGRSDFGLPKSPLNSKPTRPQKKCRHGWLLRNLTYQSSKARRLKSSRWMASWTPLTDLALRFRIGVRLGTADSCTWCHPPVSFLSSIHC